tara:strand:- start:28474 stop:28674 length:201 start_codon:yes stop_codon:yes gene_type:complete
MIKIIHIMVLTLFISACNDSDTPKEVGKDHVWKEQADMIDKAKNVEQLLNDAAIKQQEKIDQKINQ